MYVWVLRIRLLIHVLRFKLLNTDNPYNIEFMIDESSFDATNGEPVKLDTLIVNSDVVRAMKMLYDIEPGWGDEFRETVDEYFHSQNLTKSVRSVLGMTLSS